jgi:hypothetical protein
LQGWETAKLTRYRAYGLEIESERALPLRPCAAGGEADLRVAALPRSRRERVRGPDRRDLEVSPEGWTLRYDNRDGDWMAYDYHEPDRLLSVSGSLPWEVRSAPLGGLVWGVFLGLRRRTLLHGACVRLGGAGLALLGASGHGKSTLAAALLLRGGGLVSEDLLVPAAAPSGWIVEPGAPSLHLLEDAYAMLRGPGQKAPTLRDGKYRLVLSPDDGGPVPLAAICLLDPPEPRPKALLTRLSGRRALLGILEHLYGSAWIRPPDEADLRLCAALVADVPVHALSRPWNLEGVPETADLLRRRFSSR